MFVYSSQFINQYDNVIRTYISTVTVWYLFGTRHLTEFQCSLHNISCIQRQSAKYADQVLSEKRYWSNIFGWQFQYCTELPGSSGNGFLTFENVACDAPLRDRQTICYGSPKTGSNDMTCRCVCCHELMVMKMMINMTW